MPEPEHPESVQDPMPDADREALDRMAQLTPRAAPLEHLADVPPSRIPRHIAIIMDGNGRWARAQGLPRAEGHRRGGESVRAVVEECGRIGVEAVTLYSFSTENWKRSEEEIEALMALCVHYCENEAEALKREGVRVRVIGRIGELPQPVQDALAALVETTRADTGPTLCLAINYGSRQEISGAVRSIAQRVASGDIEPGSIDDALIDSTLDTAGLPDPDLVVRTAGEMRLSNFLLWQLSYAEIYVTETLWPEFGAEDLRNAIRAFASRTRRFGARPEDEGV